MVNYRIQCRQLLSRALLYKCSSHTIKCGNRSWQINDNVALSDIDSRDYGLPGICFVSNQKCRQQSINKGTLVHKGSISSTYCEQKCPPDRSNFAMFTIVSLQAMYCRADSVTADITVCPVLSSYSTLSSPRIHNDIYKCAFLLLAWSSIVSP